MLKKNPKGCCCPLATLSCCRNERCSSVLFLVFGFWVFFCIRNEKKQKITNVMFPSFVQIQCRVQEEN